MLECPKCGFNNELGRIFCHQCGTKLDLDKIKAPTRGARVRRRVASRAAQLVRTGVQLAIAGVLIFGLVLMCLVPAVEPVQPTNAELVSADNKRMQLDRLVQGTRPGSIEVTEAELNAFLHSLSFDKPKGAGLEVLPVTLRADLGDGELTVSFLGKIQFGKFFTKQFFITMSGTPTLEHGFDLKPTGGKIGRLPLPAKLLDATDFAQRSFAKIFGQLAVEREALGKLSSVEVTRDRAILRYEPAAK